MKPQLPAPEKIDRCAHIDQCNEWANAAAAQVTYAKAKKDIGMMETAQRIRLRAYVRIGELLLQIPNAQGKGHKASGPDPGSRRQTILRHKLGDAALSCIAMARVPKRMREKLIEASPPPSVTTLANLGTRPREKIERRFRAGSAYRIALGTHHEGLGGFIRWIRRHPARELARQMKGAEVERLYDYAVTADEWLCEFVQHLNLKAAS